MRFTRTTRAAGSNGIAYYKGRRIDAKDRRQIKRWKAMRRHVRQIERHCERFVLPGATAPGAAALGL
jgi:hypothetical protein